MKIICTKKEFAKLAVGCHDAIGSGVCGRCPLSDVCLDGDTGNGTIVDICEIQDGEDKA